VGKIKLQIERGEYRVTTVAVADAILRRLGELAVAKADVAATAGS
jgi:anti-sigma28 factor (negative regulator of flagellin synthesis)